ncbi:head GIN domain-containing protein [Sphingomonas sp. Leaf231]|uniref:head GIN domain-containing protein n=1 Tax=Sphingomonas sp. Leaf231 TaxID=1736301 RepID=UPI0009E96028|nr:head GIN domain-containing protein [Sphingomonas sp. Leaf231]
MRTMVLAALLPLMACGVAAADTNAGIPARGTGNVRTFDARDFSAVKLGGSDDVVVRVGGDYAVRAEGDPRILDRLKITRDGGALTISRRSDGGRGHARVFVTLPAIDSASIGGSGNMTIDRVTGPSFEGRIAGSGNMTLAQVATRALSIGITGSGTVAARGTTERLSARSAGSGSIDAAQLVARTAEVGSVGSGDIRATVRGGAEVSSVGSGDVDLGRDAQCRVRKAGSGDVRCGG